MALFYGGIRGYLVNILFETNQTHRVVIYLRIYQVDFYMSKRTIATSAGADPGGGAPGARPP